MEKGQKRTRADEVRARREVEDTRRRRDTKRYEAWCTKREAGEQLGVDPIPTCCPCFDNCGECASSLNDYGPKRKINIHTLEEECAHLCPNGLDRETLKQISEDPEWHLAPQASTPQTSKPHRHSEPLEAICRVTSVMEKLGLVDSASHQHRRKAKQPTAHHQHEAGVQHSFSLDLNTTKDNSITCHKTLSSSFSFFHPEDQSLHFTPYIIGQKKQAGQVDVEPKECYLVHYWPEDLYTLFHSQAKG